VKLMWVLAISASLCTSHGEADGAARHLARHGGAILAIAAQVLGRIADRHRRLSRLLDQLVVDALAGEQGRGGGRVQRSRADVGERNRGLAAYAAGQRELDRGRAVA